MKIINYLFLLLFIFNSVCLNNVQAQTYNSNSCINRLQLNNMQKLSLEEISKFLYDNSWTFNGAKTNQLYTYFKYDLNYSIVMWNKMYSNNENLLIYTADGKPNIVIYETNYSCFEELLKTYNQNNKSKILINDNVLITTFKDLGISIEFREYINDYSSKQYSIILYNSFYLDKEIKDIRDKDLLFNSLVSVADELMAKEKYIEAKIKYISAIKIQNNQDVLYKIEQCDLKICQNNILIGDKNYQTDNYDSALFYYKKASLCTDNIQELDQKIQSVQSKIINKKIIIADVDFNNKNYDLALSEYKNILFLEPSNMHSISRLEEIQKIKEILYKRNNLIFNYAETNPLDYSYINTSILNELYNRTKVSKSGNLFVDFNIQFDTLGNNKTEFNASSQLADCLNKIKYDVKNRQSSLSGYFLASKANLNYKLNWSSRNIKYVSKGYKSKENNSLNLDESIFKEFIYKQKYIYGKFVFQIKEKSLGNKNYNDISLIKYKTTGGPSNVIYSMIMPGMGTLRVSHGQKGWGRFASFIFFAGLSYGSNVYFNTEYQKYLNATNQVDVDYYYESANSANKVFLISSSIAATIYIHDILWVFGKGIKNRHDSNNLKKQLRDSPVVVKYNKF